MMRSSALERLQQLLDACAPGAALTPALGLAAAAQARELAAELGRRGVGVQLARPAPPSAGDSP